MHEFSIWAPNARRMRPEGRRDDLSHGRARGTRACGRAKVDVPFGAEYAFLIDDDPTPYPDPRGLRQMQGVHGPSALYDQKTFEWHDARWQGPPFNGGIIYEMHVGTFTAAGTFDSALSNIYPTLLTSASRTLKSMPIAEFPGDFGWGYDGVVLFAVTESYGGPDALKRFVDACHQHDLSVILDVVYNHFGPVGNYANKFGPYLTSKHHTPWGDAVNFEEGGSDQVRRFFYRQRADVDA